MIRRWLTWAGAILAAMGGAWLMGRRAGAVEARNKALRQANEDMAETTRRMQDAAIEISDDPAVLRDWLKNRKP